MDVLKLRDVWEVAEPSKPFETEAPCVWDRPIEFGVCPVGFLALVQLTHSSLLEWQRVFCANACWKDITCFLILQDVAIEILPWVSRVFGHAGRWWHTPLFSTLGRQRQANFWVWGQPGLQSEFQDSQCYTEKPFLEKYIYIYNHYAKILGTCINQLYETSMRWWNTDHRIPRPSK